MDATQAGEFAALLQARRDELVATSAALSHDLRALTQDRGDGSADDEHDPEGVTLSAEWSRAEGLRRSVERDLRDVDDALGRCAAGTYGVCVGCGRDIPLGRLRAVPSATVCMACAQERHA